MIAWTWLGAMAGAWVSYGARKYQFKFEEMSTIEEDMMEPVLRLIYIGICALIFELFLSCEIVTVTIGSITTERVTNSAEVQILVGVICGLAESRLGLDIYKKANTTLKMTED